MYNVSDNPMELTNLHDDGKHQAVEIPESTPEPLDDVEQYRSLEQQIPVLEIEFSLATAVTFGTS